MRAPFVGTIRPIGMRPPEAKKPKTANAAEVAPEAKKFLHFALEAALAPEAAVADSEMKGEGASSSSSGAIAVAAIEAPPEAAMAPEAAAVADSEVKVEGASSSSSGAIEVATVGGPPEGGSTPSKGEALKQLLASGTERLEVQAYVEAEVEFMAVAKAEDLRPEDRAQFEKVKAEGVGICSRCRFRSGCASCDEEKAWEFACRNTLWAAAAEAVRPARKPRGRPKGMSKGKGGGMGAKA